MKGRQENEIKLEKKIQKMLDGCPDIVKRYSMSFTNKTEMTKNAYLRYVIDFVDYIFDTLKLTDDWNNIKPSDINCYMEYIRYRIVRGEKIENKASIRATKLFAISNFFEFLLSEELVEKNPCKRVSVPKDNEEKEIVYMTPDDINIVKENILNGVGSSKAKAYQRTYRNRDVAILLLGCRTGLRVSSIVEINLEDIDFDKKQIIVTEKGNKTRNISIGKNTINVLNEWIFDRAKILNGIKENALFISNRKTRITVRAVQRLIDKYTFNLNKHITPHKMRSSCACNLLDATDNIYLVQDVLGHKNIANTRRYARVSEKTKRKAADILDSI